MPVRYPLLFAAGLWASAVLGRPAPPLAHAKIVNARGQAVGAATFSPDQNGVRIDIRITHLPPGTHGVHIHETGKCERPRFASAGGHLNPEGKKHGVDNSQGPHAGDLANLEIGSDGKGHAALYAPRLTLDEGPNSLFHPGGTSIVIHAKYDDYLTDPQGKAGAAIACGIIVK